MEVNALELSRRLLGDATLASELQSVDQLERTSGKATLPGLCKLYKADFSDRDALVRFAEGQLGESLDGLRIDFADFDWTLVGAPTQARPRTPPQT